jgi:radical SAM superfamily enzyme YgiQ (UPF0313 family)
VSDVAAYSDPTGGGLVEQMPAAGPRVLRAVLIAPSRYIDGEVAVFRMGISPNGALGALAGLAEDYNRRHAGQAQIDYEFFDEHVRQAITPTLLRRWRDAAATRGQTFVLMICGVQTVTYPRARDIALMARREGIEVIAGGVHLSAHGPSVDFLVSCGIHVAIGEVEPIWDEIIEDALGGRFRTIYRLGVGHGMQVKAAGSTMTAPDITAVPFPHIPQGCRHHYVNPSQLFIDGSRGCPFLCTFCVVKNVFGRTVRSRDPERLVAWMMARVRQDGVRAFSFTDDNFVRNPRHLELLEKLAAARVHGPAFSLWLILDVESSCYVWENSPRGERTRRFLRLCQAAGVGHVYIGLESTSDAVLQEMRKGVNRDRTDIHAAAGTDDPEAARRRLVERYRTAVRAWHEIGASVECGYIIGFNADGRGVGAQAARDLIEIGADVATFFLLAPLPGSEDYARALRDGILLEPDFNSYFQRAMVAHPTLSASQLEAELQAAVRLMWSWGNVVRRIAGGVLGIGRRRVTRPWIYLKRQLGYRLMLSSGLNTYVEGGLWRRRGTARARREATSDEDARRVYLGTAALPSGLPAIVRDDSRMESLPVLMEPRAAQTTTRSAA